MMWKIAVSALLGVLVVFGFVWHAQAFFSRDQWFHLDDKGGSTTQTLVTIPNESTTSSGSDSPNGILTPPPPTSVVPEPSTVLLVGSGLMGLGVWKLKQRRDKSEN